MLEDVASRMDFVVHHLAGTIGRIGALLLGLVPIDVCSWSCIGGPCKCPSWLHHHCSSSCWLHQYSHPCRPSCWVSSLGSSHCPSHNPWFHLCKPSCWLWGSHCRSPCCRPCIPSYWLWDSHCRSPWYRPCKSFPCRCHPCYRPYFPLCCRPCCCHPCRSFPWHSRHHNRHFPCPWWGSLHPFRNLHRNRPSCHPFHPWILSFLLCRPWISFLPFLFHPFLRHPFLFLLYPYFPFLHSSTSCRPFLFHLFLCPFYPCRLFLFLPCLCLYPFLCPSFDWWVHEWWV
mmetsp:Transcript_4272/g.8985  ORF Transcript_4272/g.8985 Transcript_4272/m.8985 type:complete len:285 (+) Transcript_4272:568-1422(+)